MTNTMESADCRCVETSGTEDSNNNNIEEDVELRDDIRRRMILHWNYRNLKEFPRELLDHGEHVKEIYLKRNNLIKLPKELGRFKSLTNIYLSGNQLRILPSEIGELENLEVLDVSQNRLQTLPPSVGKLKKLQQLILTQNQLQCLPKELKKLKQLKFLELSDNRFQSLDEDIFQELVSLEELAADRNPIRCLPRNLTALPRLRSVSVCKCDLCYLPGNPFSFAVSSTTNHRSNNRRGSRRNPASLNEQEEPPFQFRFDGNPNINYIPYWMIRLLGPALESYGCNRPFHNTPPHELPQIKFKCDARANFCFDGCIRKIRQDKGVPTLLETSLKCLHMNRDCIPSVDNAAAWVGELPGHLARHLIIGPFSQCFQCFKPIFTELWPLFFKLQTDAVPMEISEMLYPHGTINAYNNYQMNQALQNGFPQGFNFSYLNFCSHNCMQLFCKIVTSSSYYPFHDYQLILRTQLPSCQ